MKHTKPKINFWGTPRFAQIILEKIYNSGLFEIHLIITSPDKKIGRKQKTTPSLVKQTGIKNNIPYLTPEKFDKFFLQTLKQTNSDINLVAAYGKIIPLKFLNLPKFNSLNIHPSLLPKYRGASPIQTAILNGEQKTGTTLMLMDEKMDHGPSLSQTQINIKQNEKFAQLRDRLAEISAENFIKSIHNYLNGSLKPQAQNHSQASFCKLIKKEDGRINWHNTATKIYNQWRALHEWPGVYANDFKNIKQDKLKIELTKLQETNVKNNFEPGTFFSQDKKLFLSCYQNSTLQILELKPAGKNNINYQNFINGYLKKINNY